METILQVDVDFNEIRTVQYDQMSHTMEICEKLNNISRGKSCTFSVTDFPRLADLESTEFQANTISEQVRTSNNNFF
jgi:hypothetical protein